MLVVRVHVLTAELLTFSFTDSVPLTPFALTTMVLLPLLVVLVELPLVVVVDVLLPLPQVKVALPEPTQCE